GGAAGRHAHRHRQALPARRRDLCPQDPGPARRGPGVRGPARRRAAGYPGRRRRVVRGRLMTTLRPSTGAPHARILGVGGYRGSRVVSNEEICQYIDSSDEWIRTRSGIVNRRWAEPSETVRSMAVAAAGKAIADAGIGPERVGCVLISTVSHFHQTPALAPAVA